MGEAKKLAFQELLPINITKRPTLRDLNGSDDGETSSESVQVAWKHRWLQVHKQSHEYMPPDIVAVWTELEKLEPHQFNIALATGMKAINFSIDEVERIMSHNPLGWSNVLTQESITLCKKMQVIAQEAEKVRVQRINAEREPDEYIQPREIATINDVFDQFKQLYRLQGRYQLEYLFKEFDKSHYDMIQQLHESIDGLATSPVFASLASNTINTLPVEYRNLLEEYFFDWYGSAAVDEPLQSKSAYIYPDAQNPQGSIQQARAVEASTLRQYGFGNSGFETYNALLQIISDAVNNVQNHVIQFKHNDRTFIVKLGAGYKHDSQLDPFTNEIVDQEINDIGIYEVREGKPSLLAIIPSTWKCLAEKYGFYEYGGRFAFGPRVVLQAFIRSEDSPEKRQAGFQQLYKTIAHSKVL